MTPDTGTSKGAQGISTVDIDIEGGDDLSARGNIVDHEYKVKRDGEVIATVSKKWLRVRDSYGIEIRQGEGNHCSWPGPPRLTSWPGLSPHMTSAERFSRSGHTADSVDVTDRGDRSGQSRSWRRDRG